MIELAPTSSCKAAGDGYPQEPAVVMHIGDEAARLARMAIVEFCAQASLMSVQVDGYVYLLDADDLALVGTVLLQLLADGRTITPDMIPAVLGREP
jgi:hypothetical protein